MASTLDHATLSKLVEAGAVRDAEVVGCPGGWGVVVRYGMIESALAVKRGTIRTFKKFETLVSYLKDLGIVQFKVNASNFNPDDLQKRTRPDASNRLKEAFEAKSYNEWLNQKITSSLDDKRANISHDEAMAQLQLLIETKQNALAS